MSFLRRSQLVKKFPAFCGTRRFITAFTRNSPPPILILSQINPVHDHPNPISWRSILIHRISCSKISRDFRWRYNIFISDYLNFIHRPAFSIEIKTQFRETQSFLNSWALKKFRTLSFGLNWVGLSLSLLSEDRDRICSRNYYYYYYYPSPPPSSSSCYYCITVTEFNVVCSRPLFAWQRLLNFNELCAGTLAGRHF